MSILKQGKAPRWMGALQVQMSNSNYYMVYYSQAMMAATFWFTAGSPTVEKYAPWISFWMFLLFLVSSVVVLLFFDYKFMLPARQRFQNEQSWKHYNPWMAEIKILQDDMKLIKKHMGIEEDRYDI
jgi:hypothetical protein